MSVATIIKGYKRKLILTKEQEKLCTRCAGQNRLIYNLALKQRQLAYSLCRVSLNYYDQAAELKDLKEAFPFFKKSPAQTLQQSLKDLQTAFDRFFEGISGFPSYRKKHRNDSFRFPTPDKFNLRKLTKRKGSITLPKFGELRFYRDKKNPILGRPLSATIKLEAGEWYLTVQCELNVKDRVEKSSPTAKSAVDKRILEQGWGYLRQFLDYKSKWQGKLFDDQTLAAYTSIRCYACKQINPKNRKGDVFLCLRCQNSDHADINAAKNILRDGLSRIASGFDQQRLLDPLGTVSLSSTNKVGNPHL